MLHTVKNIIYISKNAQINRSFYTLLKLYLTSQQNIVYFIGHGCTRTIFPSPPTTYVCTIRKLTSYSLCAEVCDKRYTLINLSPISIEMVSLLW